MDERVWYWAGLLSTFIDILLLGGLLFFPWRRIPAGQRREIKAMEIILAGGFVGIIFLLKAYLMIVEYQVNFFGLIRLVYLDLVILLPVIGVLSLLLQAGRKIRMTGGMQVVAWGCLAAAPVGIFTSYIEPFHLKVETSVIHLRPERMGQEPICIAVMADLQTPGVTQYEREAVERLMDLKPDIIILPGDMFQGNWKAFERELPALQRLLAELKAPGGVYLTPGNVDDPEKLRRMTSGTEVKILNNRVAKVQIRGRKITVGGVDAWHDPQGAKYFIGEMEEEPGDEDIRILVSHIPDAIHYLNPQSRIDLVVSGHTHGGQVRIPLYGSLLKSTNLGPSIAAGGLHILNSNALYISRGVGTEAGQAPRIRFLCPPEISRLELRR